MELHELRGYLISQRAGLEEQILQSRRDIDAADGGIQFIDHLLDYLDKTQKTNLPCA